MSDQPDTGMPGTNPDIEWLTTEVMLHEPILIVMMTGWIDAAGAAAARALGTDFVFVARADGVMNECYDLDEAIKRLQAFEAAGADVLYAPRLASLADQEKVCKSVSLPVKALTTGELTKVTLAEFASVGVARVSLGGTLSRAYHTSVANMARAMFDEGDFSSLSGAMSGGEIEKLLKAGGR